MVASATTLIHGLGQGKPVTESSTAGGLGAGGGPLLAGRVALVTGGSRGIGRAVVRRLAHDGADVAFTFRRSEEAAAGLVAEVVALGRRAHAIRADMASMTEVKALFDEGEAALGSFDILVNNAGETLLKSIAETEEADYDRVMAVNAKATFFIIRQAASRLRRGGRIVSISSMNTVMHLPEIAVYAASKAAVEQFTLVAARELAPRKITVNTVSPGPVDTDMLRAAQSATALDLAAAMTPLRRLGLPADVADVIAFLVGPDARWLTGQNIRVAGGLV